MGFGPSRVRCIQSADPHWKISRDAEEVAMSDTQVNAGTVGSLRGTVRIARVHGDQHATVLEFLKEQGIATEEKLAPLGRAR